MFRRSFSYFSIVLALLIIFYSAVKFLSYEIIASLLTIKYFFGFFLFYLIFVFRSDLTVNFVRLGFLISAITLVEALLVNSIIPREIWLHFPKDEFGEIGHKGLFWGIYQRPYGVGTNASVTSALIVVLIALGDSQIINRKKNFLEFWLPVLAVLVSLSGSGILLLAAYYCLNYKRVSLALSCVVLIPTLLILSEANIQYSLFEKISLQYILYLIDYKTVQISDLFNMSNAHSIIFGLSWSHTEPMPLGGDFGFLNAYNYGGAFVIMVYTALCAYVFLKGRFSMPLTILLLSGIHYFVLFTLLGQLLFGYILYHSFKKGI